MRAAALRLLALSHHAQAAGTQAAVDELTVAPEVLVDHLNQRWAALDSLNASVEIQASVLKTKEGLAKDYPTIRGNILMLKPEMLRVYGRVPVHGHARL